MRGLSGAVLLAVLLGMVSLGCGGEPIESAEPAEPAYAVAVVDGIMAGCNDNDYATYSRYFDAAMREAIPEAAFAEVRSFIRDRIGDYVSRSFVSETVSGTSSTVVYTARFTDEPDDVKITVIFTRDGDDVYVSGLWFDSPKLRQL